MRQSDCLLKAQWTGIRNRQALLRRFNGGRLDPSQALRALKPFVLHCCHDTARRMTNFTILLGGDLTPTPAVARQVAGSRVIAADAGMKHAAALGLLPELWVGDFNSAPDGLPDHLAVVTRQGFPREKDKTDGELAADIAIERGATSLLFVGAFGGDRSDHEFLHLTLAIRLSEAGVPVAAHQRHAGRLSATARPTSARLPAGHAVQHSCLYRSQASIGARREMAARSCRSPIRFVADDLQ